MKYEDMLGIIKTLEFDKKKILCTDNEGVQIYVIRPAELPKKMKDKYDVKKNFQIFLKEGDREFRPNHLRIMLDLNLRIRSRPDLKKQLFTIFDNIFYGKDPDEEIKKISGETFDHFLNSIKIIANLAQLFIIEQQFNYLGESKFEPKTLFLQGWIREFIDSPKEIDNLCMSVCNRQTPTVKYTCKEDEKHKKYEENLKPLWYFNNS